MKALSVQHPWVDAEVLRIKTLEIRSWDTHFRGAFLLHAGKAWGKKQKDLFSFIEERYGVKVPVPAHPGQSGIMGIATLDYIRP